MSDTVVISTSSTDDAYTVRIPLSGGTGTGWTLATGSVVTGLLIKNTTDTTVYQVLSSSFDTNDLLCVVGGYLPSGKTLTVDIAAGAGSNLRDGGGNRPQGQTAVTITNTSALAATNWAYDHAGIGRIFAGANASGLGQSANFIEAVLTGTDANLCLVDWVPSGHIYVSVDGGAEADSGVVSEADVLVRVRPLYKGLANTTHTVVVRFDTVNLTLPATRLIQTTSATAPTLPATYGPQCGMRSQSGVQVDGVPTTDVGGSGITDLYLGYQVGMVASQWHRFKATITSIRFFLRLGSAGTARINLLRRAASSTGTWTHVGQATLVYSDGANRLSSTISGLDGTTEWQYAAVYVGAPVGFSLLGMQVTGTSVNTAALTSQGFVVFWGDSITANYGLNDASEGFPYKIAKALGLTPYNAGASGETVADGVAKSSTLFGSTITSSPRATVFLEGVNDSINETNGSTTTFQANYTSILGNAFTAWPDMLGLVLGILPNGNYSTHPRTDAAITAAVATQANCVFYSSDGVLNIDGTDLQDETPRIHPKDAGDTKIANVDGPRLLTLISGALVIDGYPSDSTAPFGSVAQGSTQQLQLTIDNNGAGALHIAAIDVSGDVTVSGGDNPANTTVAAGASTTITVVMSTSTTGGKTGTIIIHSDSGGAADEQYPLTFTATVTAAVRGGTLMIMD